MTIKTLSLTDDIYTLDGIYPKLPVFDLVQKYTRLQSTGTSEDVYIFYWTPVEYRTDFSVAKFTLEIDTVDTFDSTNKITYVDSVVGTSPLTTLSLDSKTLLINDIIITFSTNESSLDLVITKINTEVGKTVASKVTFSSSEYLKITGCTLYHTGTANGDLYLPTTGTSTTIANYYHDGNLVKGFEVNVFPRNINYDPSDTTLVRTDATQPFYWRVKQLKTQINSEIIFISKFGSYGTANGKFYTPRGVITDSLNNIYVVDTGNFRVQKFDSTGTYITQWGSYGTGNGQFDTPTGIAVDSLGNVYVTDTFNYRVQKFDSTGTYITQWGSYGTGNGQFDTPTGIAVDSLGNVYVVDTGNFRVQKFSSTGTYTTKWGSLGGSDGEFMTAQYISTDSSNNVYITDSGINRIQKFSSTGVYILKWGSSGTGDGQFTGTYGIAVDSSGYVYVIDSGNSRVQKFSSTGTFIIKYGSPGYSGDGQFYNPMGICSNLNYIYISDTNNNRIQKLQSLTYISYI